MELDHVFCMVGSDDDWAVRLAQAGWRLDAGSTHAGQGTRNRRLRWADCYLELLWVHDAAEARHNALRLDRRAAWERTGASPFGIGLRGKLSDAERVDYWLYDGLPMPVWVHRDNEDAPERPFVFALDLDEHRPPTVANPGALQVLRHTGPAPARLPDYRGPRIEHTPGSHRLELVVDDGSPLAVTAELGLSRP
jgi:hypothetical protein